MDVLLCIFRYVCDGIFVLDHGSVELMQLCRNIMNNENCNACALCFAKVLIQAILKSCFYRYEFIFKGGGFPFVVEIPLLKMV